MMPGCFGRPTMQELLAHHHQQSQLLSCQSQHLKAGRVSDSIPVDEPQQTCMMHGMAEKFPRSSLPMTSAGLSSAMTALGSAYPLSKVNKVI